MDHSSQIRIVPGADSAVLFIHGIVGTPRHFSHVLPLVQAVPENRNYYNLLLPGHGGTVQDFSASTMKDWKACVWEVFAQLSRSHEKVAVVGHSMGTLFALQLAREFPDQIPFLFLIASPIRPWVRLSGISCCMRACFGKAREDNPAEMAILRAGGIKLTKKLWQYIPWAPNMVSLLMEAHKAEKLLPHLQTKTIVFQSKKDEMVSNRSGKLLRQCPTASVTTLEGATHFYYPPEEAKQIIAAFTAVCNEKHHA